MWRLQTCLAREKRQTSIKIRQSKIDSTDNTDDNTKETDDSDETSDNNERQKKCAKVESCDMDQ